MSSAQDVIRNVLLFRYVGRPMRAPWPERDATSLPRHPWINHNTLATVLWCNPLPLSRATWSAQEALMRSLVCRDCGRHFDAVDQPAQRCFVCERMAELIAACPATSHIAPNIRCAGFACSDQA
jgi:hypothetical protein